MPPAVIYPFFLWSTSADKKDSHDKHGLVAQRSHNSTAAKSCRAFGERFTKRLPQILFDKKAMMKLTSLYVFLERAKSDTDYSVFPRPDFR